MLVGLKRLQWCRSAAAPLCTGGGGHGGFVGARPMWRMGVSCWLVLYRSSQNDLHISGRGGSPGRALLSVKAARGIPMPDKGAAEGVKELPQEGYMWCSWFLLRADCGRHLSRRRP